MNVDTLEAEKFTALAEDWWDPTGPMRMLHQLNPLRADYIASHLAPEKRRMLDVGCGGGLLTLRLAENGREMTGLDISPSLITIAKEEALKKNLSIDWFTGSLEEFRASREERFDAISCMELLEHVPDPAALVSDCSALLEPGGLLFVSTINRTLPAYLETIIGAEYLFQFLPKKTHDFARFIKPSELSAWARTAGLELVDLKGVRYRLLQRDFVLERSPLSNYVAVFKKT